MLPFSFYDSPQKIYSDKVSSVTVENTVDLRLEFDKQPKILLSFSFSDLENLAAYEQHMFMVSPNVQMT